MPMPPMQLSASSSASATSKGGDGNFGGSSYAIQQGDWNINNAGTGSVGSSAINPMYILAAGVAWLVLRKKV